MRQEVALFTEPNWYKGNLHTHTTRSDGRKEPQDAVNWYKSHGYSFIALTDHDLFTPEENHDGFIVLPGVEMSAHTVGFGMPAMDHVPVNQGQQKEIDLINAAGGISIVAHPYWHGLTFAHLESLEGYLAVEVYNGECDIDNARGYAGVYWDYLLSQGKRVLGVAVDDTHWMKDKGGMGWICVNAGSLSTQSLLSSIRQGKFYASQGPEIKQIYITEGQIKVECSPAQRINFITNAPYGYVELANQSLLEEAAFTPQAQHTYVRIEVVDEQGKTAWSNPIWL
jgi:hypothetical protein